MLRVLHINKRYPPHVGGIERHLQDLARAQARAPGVEVEVLVVSEEKPTREHDGRVTVHRGRQVGLVAANPISADVLSALRESRHDVWHFHYPFPTGELSFLSAARGRADRPVTVCTYHSDFVAQSASKRLLAAPYAALTRRFLHGLDAVIASSPNLAARSRFLVPVAEKVRVIPFGIDPAPWVPDPESEEAAGAIRGTVAGPITLFVGRLVPYKGVEVLLEAFKHVPGSLMLVGEGPLRSRLEAIASDPLLTGRVRFLGGLSQRELVAHFHAADVFALPSVTSNEAFGLVQLEAHACGLPVVSTDLPTGVPFANKHEETGLVVPPGDSVRLAAALRRILEDAALRSRLGARARERQRAEFSLDVMTDRILDLYEELIRRSGPSLDLPDEGF
jgi:glycosyltransferase involved in cell wall biosynthesis